MALAWLLGRPGVTSVIIGGRTEQQFSDNLAAADSKLADDELNGSTRPAARRSSTPTGTRPWTAKDRLSAADLALLAPYLA